MARSVNPNLDTLQTTSALWLQTPRADQPRTHSVAGCPRPAVASGDQNFTEAVAVCPGLTLTETDFRPFSG